MTLLSSTACPQFNLYWSIYEDMLCLFVPELTSRNYFRKVKAYFHVYVLIILELMINGLNQDLCLVLLMKN